MRRLVAAAVVMGCGAKPPEPMPVVTPKPAPVRVVAPEPIHVHVPRPAITVVVPHPDLSEEPRWPLGGMQHPTLEPQFNVAGALADPGISWTELCARGAQLRHDPAHRDELAYLGAWCAAEQHDAKTAVTALAPLRNSPVPGMANGVPFDIANMLVAELDADHAIQLLTDLRIRDAHQYDLLAAAYFEIGKDDDAVRATSTAMQVDYHPVLADTCHRLAREVLLGSPGWKPHLFEQFRNLSTKTVGDHVCEDLYTTVSCVVDPPGDCSAYWAAHNLSTPEAMIANVYDRWDAPRDWLGWALDAENLEDLVSAPDAKALVLAAMDGAIVSSECRDDVLLRISIMFDAVAARRNVPDVVAKATLVHELRKVNADCDRFRAQWLAANPQ